MNRLLACLSCVLTLVAVPALAGGPPMLAIEAPARAFDKATKDAAVIVRASQCEAPITAAVTGRAEGVVDGKRVTLPLTMRVTSQEGAWAVTRQWPAEGRWILVFTVDGHGRSTATATLDLKPASDGTLTSDQVARRLTNDEIASKLQS